MYKEYFIAVVISIWTVFGAYFYYILRKEKLNMNKEDSE